MANSLKIQAKKKRQLNTMLLRGLLGDEAGGGRDQRGLLKKCLEIIDRDLEHGDEERKDKAMEKVIKLLPFVIAKEKAPAVQLNIQNNDNRGRGQQGTMVALQTAQEYFRKREQRMIERSGGNDEVEDAEIVEAADTLPPKHYRKYDNSKLKAEYEED